MIQLQMSNLYLLYKIEFNMCYLITLITLLKCIEQPQQCKKTVKENALQCLPCYCINGRGQQSAIPPS